MILYKYFIVEKFLKRTRKLCLNQKIDHLEKYIVNMCCYANLIKNTQLCVMI